MVLYLWLKTKNWLHSRVKFTQCFHGPANSWQKCTFLRNFELCAVPLMLCNSQDAPACNWILPDLFLISLCFSRLLALRWWKPNSRLLNYSRHKHLAEAELVTPADCGKAQLTTEWRSDFTLRV